MSSSESDVDPDIEVPDNIRRGRGGPGGRGRKPFAPANRAGETGRQGRGQKRKSDPRWEEDTGMIPVNSDDEDDEVPGPSRENLPPARPGFIVDDSDDDDVESVASSRPANPNIRKRLSFHRRDSAKSSSLIGVRPAEREPVPDADTLKNIYSTCMQMFQTQKINLDNAFSMKFLDLMGDIIDMPEFDKKDLLTAGKMLEAGAKIYVCRVDKTKNTVLDMVSNMHMQKKKNTKDGPVGANDDDEPMAVGDDDDPVGEIREHEQKKKKKRTKKNKKFVVEDTSKISMQQEPSSFIGEARRSALKVKLMKLIDEDVDFDYYAEYLGGISDTRPATVEEQRNAFGVQECNVPTAVVNLSEFKSLEHLPFNLLENFDDAVHDRWGKHYNPADSNVSTVSSSCSPVDAANGEPEIAASADAYAEVPEDLAGHVYVPQDEPPDEYADLDVGGGGMDLDDVGFEQHTFVEAEGVPDSQERVNTGGIKSLDEFFNMYKKVKSLYTWCGTNFVKSVKAHAFGIRGARTNRVRKDPVYIDVLNANPHAKENKYLTSNREKTIMDERAFQRWTANGRPKIPYLEIDEEDEDFNEVLELVMRAGETDSQQYDFPELFRFFYNPRRTILSSLNIFTGQSNEVEDNEAIHAVFNQLEDDYIQDAGFEVERQHNDYDGDASIHIGDHDVFNNGEDNDTGGPLPIDSMFNNIPVSLTNLLGETDQETSEKIGTDSIKFTKKPKPIDMHILKRAIAQHLTDSLLLERDGTPTQPTETKTDFMSLLKYVLGAVDPRTAEHLSVSILTVGLLHVVVEKKLFLLKNPESPANNLIICRGRNWVHGDHIPMPFLIDDEE